MKLYIGKTCGVQFFDPVVLYLYCPVRVRMSGLGGSASGNGHLGSPPSPGCPYASTPSSYLYGSSGVRDSTSLQCPPTGSSSIASLRLKAKQHHCPSPTTNHRHCPSPPQHLFPYPASPGGAMTSSRLQNNNVSSSSSSSSVALAACQYALV